MRRKLSYYFKKRNKTKKRLKFNLSRKLHLLKRFFKKNFRLINRKIKLKIRVFRKKTHFDSKIALILLSIILIVCALCYIYRQKPGFLIAKTNYETDSFIVNYSSQKWHLEDKTLIHEIASGCAFVLDNARQNIPSVWKEAETRAKIGNNEFKIMIYQEEGYKVPWLIIYQMSDRNDLIFKLVNIGLFLINDSGAFKQCKSDAEQILKTLNLKP